ncbi:hypothetical protein DV737_g4272, partial [Chaetothyriales sp. CBS 132003]
MSPPTAIPEGSLILVTGANGFIASHVIQKFLQRGFKVRGTVRSVTKSEWLVKEQFRTEAADGSFELVAVEDMSKEGSHREAIRGVAAVVHIATPFDGDPNPNNVIPSTVAAVKDLLNLAVNEPSVKSFVYTSSVGAVTMLVGGVPFHVDQNSWNEAAVEMSWAPPPYTPDRALIVYVGSKVAAEKAFWEFVKERKPSFRANAVLPVTVFGPLLNAHQKATTNGMVYSLYNGHVGSFTQFNATRFIDVRDVAAIHVAAALDLSVKNARLNTWSTPFNWNDVLAILRKLYPEKKFISNLEGQGEFLGTVDDSLEKNLLEKWENQKDWISLEDGVRDMINGTWPDSVFGW